MNNQDNKNELAKLTERYKGCNLLMPLTNETQINPFYKLTVMEVPVDTSDNSGDVFKVGSVKVGNDYLDAYSPSKPLLMKLASAAGIQFDPDHTGGEYLSKNCYKARAYGAIRLPDGTSKTHCDEKVINLDDEEDNFRLEFMDKSIEGIADFKAAEAAAKMFKGHWKDGVNKYGKPCKFYVIADEDRQKYIDRSVMVNMTLLRKTFAEKAMTGAITRVIRALTGLKGMYTKAELGKPFAIPRVTFSPDYTNPEVQRAMLAQGMSSVSNMFGSSAALPNMNHDMPPINIDEFNVEEFTSNPAFVSDQVADQPYDEAPETPAQHQHDEKPQRADAASADGGSFECADCHKPITPAIAEYSQKNFNAPLCMACQKARKAGN